jgi:hypothetical protein
LLQKGEESAISLSVKKRMLVDDAKADSIPVSPKKTSFIYRVYYWTLIPLESYIQMIYWTPKLSR